MVLSLEERIELGALEEWRAKHDSIDHQLQKLEGVDPTYALDVSFRQQVEEHFRNCPLPTSKPVVLHENVTLARADMCFVRERPDIRISELKQRAAHRNGTRRVHDQQIPQKLQSVINDIRRLSAEGVAVKEICEKLGIRERPATSWGRRYHSWSAAYGSCQGAVKTWISRHCRDG
jgi:hypothetical protein